MILLCNPRSDVMMSLTKLIKLVTCKYPLTKFCTFLFSLLSMAVFSIRKIVVNLHSFYGFWLNQASRIQKSHFLISSNSTFFTKFPHAVLLCFSLYFKFHFILNELPLSLVNKALILSLLKHSFSLNQLIQFLCINSFNSFILVLPTH